MIGGRAIFTCGCSGVQPQAKTVYSLHFPKDPIPPVYSSRQGYKVLDTLPASDAKSFLASSLRKKGRWAYYLDWDDQGSILACVNLLNGKVLR